MEPKPQLRFAALIYIALAAGPALGASVLQIAEPWQTTGSNAGAVGTTALGAVSANDRWLASFSDEVNLYSRVDLFGAGAIAGAPPGDFFGLGFGPSETDTFTITLQGPLLNPVFFIGDIDVIGASVTAPAGGTNLTSNADGQWSGLTLTALTGAPQGDTGAFGTVQYLGLFPTGTSFVFAVDFDLTTFSRDTIGIGVAAVPLPAVAWLFPAGLLAGLGWMRRQVRHHPS